MRKFVRTVTAELLRFVSHLLLVALAAAILAGMVQDVSWAEFFRDVHLDRDGMPIGTQFGYACGVSLPILGVAVAILMGASSALAWLCQQPGFAWIRILVLAASAMPSFLIPFVPYLVIPGWTFTGMADGGVWIPAICLAIGDCNLGTTTTGLREALRSESRKPHLLTLESMGQSVTRSVWMRASVSLVATLVGRVPHLIGGLVAIELLYNINGLGIAAYRAVMVTPADLHWLLWICVLGVCLRSLLRVVELGIRFCWLPESIANRTKPDQLRTYDTTEQQVGGQESLFTATDSSNRPPAPRDWQPECAAGPPNWRARFGWVQVIHRARYYLQVRKTHRINFVLAIIVMLLFAISVIGLGVYGEAPIGASFEPPSDQHWLGTEQTGDDLISIARTGLGQMVLPTLLAILLAVIGVPLAMLRLASWIRSDWCRRAVTWADRTCLFLAEFIETLPKLLVLMAVYSVIAGRQVTAEWLGMTWEVNTMVLRLFAVIGLLHAPQVYRAVRDELTELNHAMYLESARMSHVSWWRMIIRNVLRNHCLHLVLIHIGIVVAGLLHYDAVLGLMGVRGRGVVFTWGSNLGTGVEAYMQYGPLEWFNPWVMVTSMWLVWLGILTFWLLAESLKILWGGYVYRLR